jgi:post-segregation antitoxin (ccd killing protein)
MTELRITLPERLARDARKAGLLTPQAIRTLLRQAMRRKAAARAFLENAERVAAAGIRPLSEDEIQAEIDAARKARRRRAARGR